MQATTIALWIGVALLVLGLWPSTLLRQITYLAGVGTLVASLVVTSFSFQGKYVPGNPSPPVPTPAPYSPQPAPINTGFAQAITAAFTGTKAEAQELAAIFQGIASNLVFDGTHKPEPVITDTRRFGSMSGLVQEYSREMNRPTDIGVKFGPIENLLAQALTSQGYVKQGSTLPMDELRRAGIARVYMEAATGLQMVK